MEMDFRCYLYGNMKMMKWGLEYRENWGSYKLTRHDILVRFYIFIVKDIYDIYHDDNKI